MTPDELDRIAGLMAASQGRTLDVPTMHVWWDALQDLDGDLAFEALRRLIRDSTDFITPAVIRQTANLIASERITSATMPTPPSGLTDAAYLRWLRAWRTQVAAGRGPEAAAVFALKAVGQVSDQVEDDGGEVVVALPGKERT